MTGSATRAAVLRKVGGSLECWNEFSSVACGCLGCCSAAWSAAWNNARQWYNLHHCSQSLDTRSSMWCPTKTTSTTGSQQYHSDDKRIGRNKLV